MEFRDTGLPSHPAIEKAFETLQQFDKDDQYTSRGVLIARLIATKGIHKDPEAIAAGLLAPLAQDLGPFLCARADLPGRIPEILEALFTFGKTSMTGVPMDQAYAELDPAVRSVILASSIRVFEVTAEDLEKTLSSDPHMDRSQLSAMLTPIRNLSDVFSAKEAEELALVKQCQDVMHRIEDNLDGAGIKLAPAARPRTPKP